MSAKTWVVQQLSWVVTCFSNSITGRRDERGAEWEQHTMPHEKLTAAKVEYIGTTKLRGKPGNECTGDNKHTARQDYNLHG